MDSRDSLLKGGESGAAFKKGNAGGSLIIKAVTWADDLQMPPKKKLGLNQIEDLKKWIAMGAPDPREAGKMIGKDKKSHWAFQPVGRPAVPAVKNAAWCNNAVDKFVLAKLEAKGMLPAGPAEKEALLRRAYFDLIGLPPTPTQIEDFVRDPNPGQAYERVIDQLLADPAYGERWARHWLDTARYSDTTGLVGAERFQDFRYAYAYSYRDWVIRSLNTDMPYDQFIINQLAADKVSQSNKKNLAALGFLTVGQRFTQNDDVLNDRIDAVGRGFLGLTIACARCHDHKFDPITAADYYALRGVFDSISEPKEGPIVGGDPNSKSYQEFNLKLADLENKAVEAFYHMEREVSDKLRKNAAAAFEAAYLSRRDASAEEKQRGTAILQKQKLPPRFATDTIKLNPNHPVTGLYVKMITMGGDRDKGLKELLEGRAKGPVYNSAVTEFLKKQPRLPSDVHEVSVLFGAMMAQIEPRVAGLYAEMRNKSKDPTNSPQAASMELVTYPFGMIPEAAMTMDKLREEGRRWGIVFGPQLEARAGLGKINELKLTSRGGPVRAMVVEDLPKPRDSPLFVRGNPPKPGDAPRIIPRRFLEVLSANGTPSPFTQGSGRMELAQAIASKSNPLTARVLVNRVWMHHFGEGLVRTPDDLGNQSGKPSHPELLDFLANWFTEDLGPSKPAWSLKALHKAIMLSNTYQQSSNTSFRSRSVNYETLDPANNLLWHANVRRLDFESLRDSLLSMAGTLDRSSIGGPSVNLTEEPYSFRRAVYGYIDRSKVPDLLMQFDMANPEQPNTKRTSTIVPQQALFLMNSPFVAAIVQKIVSRKEVVKAVKVEQNTEAGIAAIFKIVLQRNPSPSEKKMALDFLLKENKLQAGVKNATAQINKQGTKRAEGKLKAEVNSNNKKQAIVNEGKLVKRVTFSPWETLVQALLFSNEAAYVN